MHRKQQAKDYKEISLKKIEGGFRVVGLTLDLNTKPSYQMS
jgi:hypothetical protein